MIYWIYLIIEIYTQENIFDQIKSYIFMFFTLQVHIFFNRQNPLYNSKQHKPLRLLIS